MKSLQKSAWAVALALIVSTLAGCYAYVDDGYRGRYRDHYRYSYRDRDDRYSYRYRDRDRW